MKMISRITQVMRICCIILLCFAVVFSVYASVMSSASWSTVKEKLETVGADAGFVQRTGFVTSYFVSMDEVLQIEGGSAARAAGLTKHFASLNESYAQAQAAISTRQAEGVYDYYLTEFDFPAFLETFHQREDNAEQLAINEVYSYLDSFSVAVAPGGKKLPSLTPANGAATYLPGFYETFAAENGEEAVGSYYAFVKTLESMVQAYAQENTLTSAADYVKTITAEDYLAAHEALESQEVTENHSFLNQFAKMAEENAEAGVNREALEALFAQELAVVQAQYADAAMDDLLISARTLIDSGVLFDGSYQALISHMQNAKTQAQADSFDAFLSGFCKDLVAQADESADAPVIVMLWKGAAIRLYLWGADLLLVILAVTLKKALSTALVRRQQFEREPEDPNVLLRVEHLKQYFRSGEYVNKAVDDVSFYIKKGEVFGLVGESGCGKTTTGRTIINLYDPTEGDVYFQGLRISSTMNGAPVLQFQEKKELQQKIKALKEEQKQKIRQQPQQAAQIKAEYGKQISDLKRAFSARTEQIQKKAYESAEEKRRSQQLYRNRRKAELTKAYEKEIEGLTGQAAQDCKKRYETEMQVAAKDNMMTKMQMIFQDPIASINPRMTVREIIAEGLRIRGVTDKKYIDEKVYEMLELVGLVPEHADRYPHEFSGGQRQRIGIARAIVLEPDLIIADEPISALDVSIQAQVINLLNELRNKMGLTILFIAHNLSVVKYFSDRIAVMYFGRIVEMTTSDELFEHPLHPYTKSLLSAIPYPDPHYEKMRKRIEYNPTLQHDYSKDKPSMHEITPGHFIHCNEAELAAYRKELGL